MKHPSLRVISANTVGLFDLIIKGSQTLKIDLESWAKEAYEPSTATISRAWKLNDSYIHLFRLSLEADTFILHS